MMVGLVKMTALTNIRQTIKHCLFAAILAKKSSTDSQIGREKH